ncbi:MAG: calcium/sodium antiporter [Deltaproteobacteria bacterium]|nr:calcium/sodium antiporter [Deltaproteobacteria bacterium]
MSMSVLQLLGGFVMLTLGAEGLVRGGASLSRRLGVSTIIVGLTVVSYGTSFPEFLVCTIGAARGQTELALGNVIGSNICNIGLVLGVAALIRPIRVARVTVKRDMPPLIGVTVAVIVMSLVGAGIGRVDGALLVLGSVFYTAWHVVTARRQYLRASSLPGFDEKASHEKSVSVNMLFILLGGLALWLGSEGVIRGAVNLSRILELDMRFVALTIVALGTSLPELAASCVASARGEEGISLGNVIGSNVMNITFVLGFAALIRPIPVALDLGTGIDMGVMLFVVLVLWPILKLRYAVSRTGGLLLVLLYCCYIGYRAWVVFSA